MPSSGRSPRRLLASLSGLAVAATGLSFAPLPAFAAPDGSGLVISEVYGGGGGTGAAYNADFVELFNPTSAPIPVGGMALQYRSATASSAGQLAGQVKALGNGEVAPGDTYVVQVGPVSSTVGAAVPADFTTSGTIDLSGSNGQVLLLPSTVPAAEAGDLAGKSTIVDMVGYGTTPTSYESARTGASPSATTSAQRNAAGLDTDDNSRDFVVLAPSPGAGSQPPVVQPPVAATIAEIQGTGAESPLKGRTVTTTGVVTAVPKFLYGFYLQTPGTGDESSRTGSDGVFVYFPTGSGTISVQPGDHVEVTGRVDEYAGQTQVVSSAAQVAPATGASAEAPVAYTGEWPDTAAEKEALEGMLFRPQGAFTVADTYGTNTYGEVGLAQGDEPLLQPTEVADAQDTAAIARVVADNAARAITLDDGSGTDYTKNQTLTPPYVSNAAPVRVGADVEFVQDVILTQGGSPSAPTYRFQPLRSVSGPDYTATSPAVFENTRTAAPDAGRIDPQGEAELKIASFNVLNYFTTLGDADDDNVGDDGCTSYKDRTGDGNNVNSGCDQRGAWDPQDFRRQQEKIVSAINALDADVVGLMEIENSLALGEEADEATRSLVAALNAAAGSEVWAANPSSTELPAASEMDVITNAIIYKTAAVTRTGEARALGELSSAGEAFDNAREPIAQVFTPKAGGEPFLFVVNHFKSKGSGADDGTGQGNANPDRVRQAEALAAWVAEVQGQEGVDATYLLGDFNSYTMEDPMQVLYGAGYSDVEAVTGHDEYSYLFSGLVGSLDHVLANDAALDAVTGADIWNINSGESIALEYSRWNYSGTDFHEATPFRSSDHDPVVVGLDTIAGPTVPGPTNPGPADPPTPGPTDPTPGPTDPEPTPTDPTPTDPEPTPTDPEPVTPSIKPSVNPGRIVAGKTRAKITVRVAAEGEDANGWVRIETPGKPAKVVKFKNGKASVRLWPFGGAGEKTLTITYNGRGDVAARTITRTITVVAGK